MFDNYKAYYRIEATHSNFLKEEYNFYEAIEKFIISNTNLLESIHIICDHSFEELQFKYRKKYIKIKKFDKKIIWNLIKMIWKGTIS